MTDDLTPPHWGTEANPADVQDIARPILDAMIKQTMALRYFNAMKHSPEPLTLDEAMEAALATWDSDWDGEWNGNAPPRTIEAGIEAVDQDLQYWTED